MRIAVSSRSFRRPLAAGDLTQLEWVERCASELEVDGILPDIVDFPRTDPDYVAQLRKVAIDLGIVPLGLDAFALLHPAVSPPAGPAARDAVLAVATGFGAAVIRTALPAPGDVPPRDFVEAVALAKAAGRAAKGVNVTLVVAPAPGTIGNDLAAIKHLLKDVDSAWIRACPAVADAAALGPKDRVPLFEATVADDAASVVKVALRSWLLLDADTAEPWTALRQGIARLREAEAEERRRDRSGRLGPG